MDDAARELALRSLKVAERIIPASRAQKASQSRGHYVEVALARIQPSVPQISQQIRRPDQSADGYKAKFATAEQARAAIEGFKDIVIKAF